MRISRLIGAALSFALVVAAAPVSVAALSRDELTEIASSAAVTDPPLLAQQAYIKASNTDASDNFRAVAISGDTIVVGAPFEDSNATGVNGDQGNGPSNSGAAYVFVRTNGTWAQQAYLKASNTGLEAQFGTSVAISGDTIVVGAPEEDGGANASGAAYVFTRTSGEWAQQAYLKASNTQAVDRFGSAVAIHNDTIVVGAKFEDGNGTGGQADESVPSAGAAYVFVRSNGVWAQQAYLKASNPGVSDHFGGAVAVSGDTIAVGAALEDSDASGINGDETSNAAEDAGAVYVFARSGTAWAKQAYLKASNTDRGDGFGSSLAMSGTLLVVGAPSEDGNGAGVNPNAQADDSLLNAGAAYVFGHVGAVWNQHSYLKASNPAAQDAFGSGVGADGTLIAVGAPNEDSALVGLNRDQSNNDADESGAAYVFRRSGAVFVLDEYLKASNTGAGDTFGQFIGVSGTSLVAGAGGEASAATGVNGDGSDNSKLASGAAYAFGPPCAVAPFTDVTVTQTFCAEIEWMKGSAISTGFGDGTYRPAAAVSRQAMSAFMARFAAAPLEDCVTPPFSDVDTDHPFCSEIRWMKEAGISGGFTDGTYRPNSDVTRQAMSAFMARLAGAVLTPCATQPFNDVPADHQFCPEIQWMKETGISTGFDDGTYRPAANVTRQAMSAFIYRLNDAIAGN